MSDTELRYDKMVEDALRAVVRDALTVAAEHGLPGEHHFYITFRTHHGEVKLPDYIRARHPDEMTIVLQHQFWGLEVTHDWFAVTLSFSGKSERLHIPFAAVTGFADPSAKFGLQFQVIGDDLEEDEEDEAQAEAPPAPEDAAAPRTDGDGNVVTLDAFRKK
ncbi:MAG: SspB family protein [Actinomycetota bacterium]